MTYRPTQKRQTEFVDKYLGGGTYEDYTVGAVFAGFSNQDYDQACAAAMVWLDESNVRTLAEAWEKCPRADWLGWMFARMNPGFRDLQRWWKLVNKIYPTYYSAGEREQYAEVISLRDDSEYPEWIEDIASTIWVKLRVLITPKMSPVYDHKKGARAVRKAIPNPWLKGLRQ